MSTLIHAPQVRPRRRQRGIALILVTVGALALIGMAGLALDLGVTYIAKSRLQNALDAAALRGAKVLNKTRSVSLATTAAQADFATNMSGFGITAVVEMSPTLQPFVNGGLNLRFVRVSVDTLPVTLRLAQALPGIGESLNVAGSAVAGPMPLSNRICAALPVALCGTGGDTDCSDGACFGYTADATTELELKDDGTTIGPGNFGLVVLDCGTGAACIREGMAGKSNLCFTPGGTITVEPGGKSGPTSQGLNTRFNIYKGGVSASDYPPDVVIRHVPVIFHDAYELLLANPLAWDIQSPPGRPQRRMVVVPVIDCSTPINGRKDANLLGGACFFLTRPVEDSGPGKGTLYGQLISGCEADGSVDVVPDADTPFYDIRLFRDPGSDQS
ncbi:MAG: pilus assembly protein TadG-related protein [Sinimarinibacterium sp.]|jgi:hypothetical protein